MTARRQCLRCGGVRVASALADGRSSGSRARPPAVGRLAQRKPRREAGRWAVRAVRSAPLWYGSWQMEHMAAPPPPCAPGPSITQLNYTYDDDTTRPANRSRTRRAGSRRRRPTARSRRASERAVVLYGGISAAAEATPRAAHAALLLTPSSKGASSDYVHRPAARAIQRNFLPRRGAAAPPPSIALPRPAARLCAELYRAVTAGADRGCTRHKDARSTAPHTRRQRRAPAAAACARARGAFATPPPRAPPLAHRAPTSGRRSSWLSVRAPARQPAPCSSRLASWRQAQKARPDERRRGRRVLQGDDQGGLQCARRRAPEGRETPSTCPHARTRERGGVNNHVGRQRPPSAPAPAQALLQTGTHSCAR